MTSEFFVESNAGTRALPSSLATKAGGFVFVSGQLAGDENGDVIAGGIEAHTCQQGWLPEGYGPVGVIMCAPQ
jgi:enamine deaminase RidA (YjgF/YER057c/UK114 family)